MPAGLDGNPQPLVTPTRERVLAATAERVLKAATGRERTLVAIDGRSGSGKSTFADEVCARLEHKGVTTLRSTTDSFHRPGAERLRAGASSPEGYYLDSHQIDVITSDLLQPFAAGADRVCVAAFDEPSDSPAVEFAAIAGPTVLVFDGLFLQRPEFEHYWDLAVHLIADARLDERWMDFLLVDLPADPSDKAATIDGRLERTRWPRYRKGWAHYLATDQPADKAHLVIDNNDLAKPFFIGTAHDVPGASANS